MKRLNSVMKLQKRIMEAAMKQYEADHTAIKKAKEDNDADYQAKLAAYQTELTRVQRLILMQK